MGSAQVCFYDGDDGDDGDHGDDDDHDYQDNMTGNQPSKWGPVSVVDTLFLPKNIPAGK